MNTEKIKQLEKEILEYKERETLFYTELAEKRTEFENKLSEKYLPENYILKLQNSNISFYLKEDLYKELVTINLKTKYNYDKLNTVCNGFDYINYYTTWTNNKFELNRLRFLGKVADLFENKEFEKEIIDNYESLSTFYFEKDIYKKEDELKKLRKEEELEYFDYLIDVKKKFYYETCPYIERQRIDTVEILEKIKGNRYKIRIFYRVNDLSIKYYEEELRKDKLIEKYLKNKTIIKEN